MQLKELGNFLEEINHKIEIEDETEYNCGGIRLAGQGIFLREKKVGSDIRKKFVQHTVKKNEVVYSTLFADKGAFAIATEDDEELVFSEKFISFKIIDDDVLPEYLHVIFQSDYLSKQCVDLKTGMAAFSLSHVSKKKLLKLKVPVPDINLQIDIVEKYIKFETKLNKLYQAETRIAEDLPLIRKKYIDKTMGEFSMIPFKQIAKYVSRPIELDPSEMYKQITVKLYGNGLVLRKIEMGANIKSTQYCVEENDLIYSKIDVKSGAIGFVPEELAGGVVTADFPIINLDTNDRIDRDFLILFFSSDRFMDLMQEKSKGTTNRVRTKKTAFLDFDIPWGEYEERKKCVEDYKKLEESFVIIENRVVLIEDSVPSFTTKYLNKLLNFS